MFGSTGLPHGFCFLWNPQLLWLHVVSDALTALAYFLIPVAIIRVVRKRRDIPFNGIFFCFAGFIIACGSTHVMEIVTLWNPVYWISGCIKAITAVISLVTFVLLIRLTPSILSFPHREDLTRANRELTAVLESTTMYVVAMDSEWKISYLNRHADEVFRSEKNLQGLTIWEALPGIQTQTAERLRTVMSSRKLAEFESYYPPLDLSTSVRALPSENGGITLFFSDIGQERRLQQQLAAERALREQRIESLAQMAAGLAHEISNPLGIIHARASDLAELAQDGTGINSEVVTTTCASIVKTSDRAIRILRGLRMFAREGANDPMERASLAGLIEQAVDLVHARFTAHGIRLDMMPIKAPEVFCREVQIGQIILNLLNNAFDAIDGAAGGERWVRIQATQANDFAHIDVIDSGPGIAPEHREHLMQPFYTTKAGAGMGVGLSLSRTMAQDHHGTLSLTEVEGHTCFRLSLPIAPIHPHVSDVARRNGIGPLASQGAVG